MTPDEIATMSRVVAQHFGLWTPGQKCNEVSLALAKTNLPKCSHGFGEPHEIPCPDLTQPEWFVRLLKATRADILGKALDTGQWQAWLVDIRDDDYHETADTPEKALLLAAYQLVQRKEIK